MTEILRVTDPSGALLARGIRSMEGLVGLMELLLVSPSDLFLLAFRLRSQPGHPVIQAPIPYLVVDDQGRTIGELSGVREGLTRRTYTLMSDGVEYLKVPSFSGNTPNPVLQRGSQVALVTEDRPFLAKPMEYTWQMRFTAPCTHLHVLALLVHVASRWGTLPV